MGAIPIQGRQYRTVGESKPFGKQALLPQWSVSEDNDILS